MTKSSQKIKYNLLIGMRSQAVAILFGIVLPKIILVNYGSEVNGLLSSITNIYAYIAIVEAGVAAASCQALYQPVSEGNKNKINEILSATNIYYERTGKIYLLLIIVFACTYPVLVKTEIPYVTVVLIILFNGTANVVNYFFHGKYLILLKADGRNYIRESLNIFSTFVKQISKIILINSGFDVVFVQFAVMLVSFVQMIYIAVYISRNYPWVDLTREPDYTAISQSKNVFIHEINYLITNNADTVLLTVFSTLKAVSVYSLYSMLFGMINRVLRTIKDALEFKIAHAYYKDRKEFLELFHTYEVYYITIAFAVFTIAGQFTLSFLRLYTAGITDVNYIDRYLPLLFVFINMLEAGKYPSDAMVHIAGHFKRTQRSAITESVINLVVSVILVVAYGIHGVLIGTIIASLYRANYLILYINRNIIYRNPLETYKCWGVNFVIYFLILYAGRWFNFETDSFVKLIMLCIPYSVAVMLVYITVISLSDPRACKYLIRTVKRLVKIYKPEETNR